MGAPKGHPRYGGRTKGTVNKRTQHFRDEVAAAACTPLEHMLAVLRDEKADPDRKDRMAAAAAPYIHPRLASVEMKVEAEVTHLTAEQRVERAEAFAERPVLAGASHGPLIEHEAAENEQAETLETENQGSRSGSV
jgi:hypothetical protein